MNKSAGEMHCIPPRWQTFETLTISYAMNVENGRCHMMLVIGDKLALSFEQSNFTMSNIFTLLGSAILFLGLVKRNCDTYGQKNTKKKKKNCLRKLLP